MADSLNITISDEGKALIALVKKRLSVLYDTDTEGAFAQSVRSWDDDMWAVLFEFAIGELNSALPTTIDLSLDNYPLSSGAAAYALQLALIIAVIQQLRMVYVEQPDVSSTSAPFANRRDYLDRWGTILSDFENQLKDACQKLTLVVAGGSLGKGFKLIINIRTISIQGPSFGRSERPMPWWLRI